MFKIHGLYKKFGEKQVLNGVDLEIKKGEVFTIIGPSGQGKSTLLRIMNLLETPTSGSVIFDGKDLFEGGRVSVDMKRRMGMVFQNPTAFNMNVFDNVALGLKYRGLKKAEIKEKVEEALLEIGLSGYEKRLAKTLSGGEMQRVSLARAIVTEPDILFMDEPTASLDPVNTEKIEDLIHYYNKEKGITIVMSTHDLMQGQRLADRIGVMIEGVFYQKGTPDEVFSKPANESVARFIGINNIIYGKVIRREEGGKHAILKAGGVEILVMTGFSQGSRVSACIRPEEITVHHKRIEMVRGRNIISGIVSGISRQGRLIFADVDCGAGLNISALVTWEQFESLSLKKGDEVFLSFKPRSVHVMEKIDGSGEEAFN
ncbi:ABC transporter ATP-binding protein [Methanoplanus sp. FWC-SCC4]|uniref:Molybdate/tungstate import ATP-binding protein WtpC n=1 Tax=Methanochimaera problematica TaxID=2609417 RepID=A0AA97FA11_9EURY|nr:ABC transporter ATP-binding protein [Methanoplanus sp. FWC-SCC4]WOF15322.1 ABC transporter ATP-binding protein [Methanoplanus sp. FWC-SCC4]